MRSRRWGMAKVYKWVGCALAFGIIFIELAAITITCCRGAVIAITLGECFAHIVSAVYTISARTQPAYQPMLVRTSRNTHLPGQIIAGIRSITRLCVL